MPFYKLKWREHLVLLGLVLFGYIFTVTQKHYIPEAVRPVTLLVLLVGICFLFFLFVRPPQPRVLAKFLSMFFGICTLLIIILVDIILKPGLSYKTAIVLAAAVGSPYLGMYCYTAVRKRKTKS